MRTGCITVVLAVVVVAFGTWFLVFRTQVWEGEVPAVVAGVAPDRMYVGLPGPPLPGMLPGSGTRPRWLAADLLPGATKGERLTCRIRQTYQPNVHLATGARTEVLSCRR